MAPDVPAAAPVIVRFMDDEIMEGQVTTVTLEEPNLTLAFDGSSNNEEALIPLPSVKRITLGFEAPPRTQVAPDAKKVAIRFLDGEVLKGYLDGELVHAPFGVTVRLLSADKDRLEILAIPYTALKALFYVKSWDSRPPEFGKADLYLDQRLSSPLVDLVSNMGQLEKLRKRGAISESEFQRKRKKILDEI